MEALTLSQADYKEGLRRIAESSLKSGSSYVSQFKITFPQGINTASALTICRVIEDPTTESKIELMRVCIKGKNVEVKCPNGETEKFCMNNIDDTLDAFPLFQKDPLALTAIADSLYGYILKKYVRLSRPSEAAAEKTE